MNSIVVLSGSHYVSIFLLMLGRGVVSPLWWLVS